MQRIRKFRHFRGVLLNFRFLFVKVASLHLFSGQFAFVAKIEVLWFEQKIFLCCIKGKEQRYFRNSAQNQPC